MYFLDTDSKLRMSELSKVYSEFLFRSSAWSEIVWHETIFPDTLIKVVREAGKNVHSFTCSSTSEEHDFTMDLNKVLCNLTSLKVIRLEKCRLVYSWLFLRQTNMVTHMYVHDCVADQNSMIVGINALVNLKHLEITKCRLMSAYNICQAVRFSRRLTYLDVSSSGYMKSVLACVVLNKCTSLSHFFFH